MKICLLFVSTLIGLAQCQDFIVPEYVRADEFGTAYFRAPAPKIGPTKSKFHIENLIKLESELIGLGELILETEEKMHQKALLQKEDRLKKAKEGKDGKKDYYLIHDDHEPHNYTKETA